LRGKSHPNAWSNINSYSDTDAMHWQMFTHAKAASYTSATPLTCAA
jgi:hypothetical protein